MACNDISDLSVLLRKDGDTILNGTSKLSLSTTLLKKLNDSLTNFLTPAVNHCPSFNLVENGSDIVENFLDLQYIYDFLQKTLALKILPERTTIQKQFIDLQLFQSLKFLEIQRFSFSLIKGVKSLRAQLNYLICTRSLGALNEVLESCGADKAQGFIWNELKEAGFAHNNIKNLDGSLEFAPWLERLDLSHNDIVDASPLNCLLNLKYLNLSYNKIDRVPPFSGPICDKLEVLVLRDNFIEDVRDLYPLPKLKELDLRNNCIVDHSTLIPLINMTSLCKLSLEDNPICFHPQHRLRTVRFLNINAEKNDFNLDNLPLNRHEVREVGFFQSFAFPFERSSSYNSIATESTIIRNSNAKGVESSDGSLDTRSEMKELNARTSLLLKDVVSVIKDNQTMQDSGIVARPASPSENSIGKNIKTIF